MVTLSEKHLFTGAAEPNEVIILFEARDPDRAALFLASPELGERMKKAGVIDQPDVYFLTDH